MNGMAIRWWMTMGILGAALQVQAAPTVVNTGAAVLTVTGAGGVRSSIAVDSAATPHVVTTEAPGNNFYFSDLVNGSFSTVKYDSSALFNSPQFGSPHMEIDANDTAWISATFWYPNMGIGITVRPNIKSKPGAWPSFNSEDIWGGGTYDVANLSLDPSALGKCYFGSHRGVWEEYTFNASAYNIYESANGTVNDGAGGEKAYFWISKAGSVQHANGPNVGVKHHATEWSYNNSLRAAAGLDCLKWSDWDYYPGMLNDHAYPSVVSDSTEPQTAYIVAVYDERAPYGIFLNIWHGTDNNGNGYFAFSPQGGLLCLDPDGRTGTGGRYEVQQYPANRGGVWVSWIRAGRAKLRYVPANAAKLADCGPEVDVCAASVVGSICVDFNGDIHMSYVGNNAVQYRRITVSGDSRVLSKYTYLAGDYDGNGYDDLCVYAPSNGTWYTWFNKNGSWMRTETKQWGWAEAQAVPADYDGDGITDRAVFAPTLGSWYVWKSKTQTQWTTQWGWSESMPLPADYSGTGCATPAVYDPSTGRWYIQLANGKTKTLDLGYPAAIPVPGDYNGDGRDDIAVYSPDTGAWTARDVLTGKVILNLNWGWASARPVPFDYNGDGRHDLVVYDSGTGKWYCNFLNGQTRTFLWGGGQLLPVPGRYRRAHPSFRNAQFGVYYPDTGSWAIREFLMEFLSPWYLMLDFGFPEARPPAYLIE